MSTLRDAQADEWKAVVDDMLTVCHMVASDDPRESINRLIDWHVSVSLDPTVSSDAQALIDKGRAQAAQAEPVAEVIWHDQTFDLFPPRPGKIIDASIAFMESAPIGTKLYTHPPTLRPLTDAKLAECMLAVDEPMQWGRLGSDGGTNMMRKTMRAIERALAEANGMTLEPITSAASPNVGGNRLAPTQEQR